MKKMFEIAVFAGLIGIFGAGEVFGMKPSVSSKPSSPSSDFTRKPSMFFSDTKQDPAQNQAKFKELKRGWAERSSSSSTDARSSAATSSAKRESKIGSARQSTRIDSFEKPQELKSGSIGVAVTPVVSTVVSQSSSSSPGGKALTVGVSKVDLGPAKKLERTQSLTNISKPHFEKPELRKTKSESSLGKTPALTVKIGSGAKTKKPDATEGEAQSGTVMVAPTIGKRPSFSKSKTMKAEQSTSSPSSSSHQWVKGEIPKTKRKTDIKIGGHRMAAAGAGAIALALGIAGIDAVNDDYHGNADAVVGPAPTQEVVEKPVDVSEKQSSSADIFAVDEGDGGFGFN